VDGYLKQSTAAQTRTIGPFVDDVDFKTLENTLTIANTDILIKKNGAASAAKNSGGATADGSGGLYAVTWDATDTSAVGQLSYSVKVAGALVAFGTYTVLEEAIYDALFVASANAFTGAAGATKVTGVVLTDTLTTYTGNTVQTGDSFARLGAPAGASVSADIAAIEAQTDDIGAAGAGLTALASATELAKVPKSDGTATWNATALASLQQEATDALETTIADSIPADGTRPTVKQALYILTQFMLERAVSGTTVTVKKADGSTTLFTLTLNDGTTPTSITRAT
jgi:hypothetical protein